MVTDRSSRPEQAAKVETVTASESEAPCKVYEKVMVKVPAGAAAANCMKMAPVGFETAHGPEPVIEMAAPCDEPSGLWNSENCVLVEVMLVMARLVEPDGAGRVTMAPVGLAGLDERATEAALVMPQVKMPSPTKPGLHTHTPLLLRLALALQGDEVPWAIDKATKSAKSTVAAGKRSFINEREVAMIDEARSSQREVEKEVGIEKEMEEMRDWERGLVRQLVRQEVVGLVRSW